MTLLDQEREAAQLLAQLSPATLGDRLRQARLRQGRSIRDLAAAAGLSKTSVVRLEQGQPAYPLTVVKLCAALGLHLAALANPSGNAPDNAAVHRHADDRWFDLTDFGAGPLGGLERPLSPAERARFVAEGAGVVPLLILKSRLPEGRLLSTVLEVHGPSPRRSHPGEEFVYVLEGAAQITLGDAEHTLGPGESIVFRSAEPHAYAPDPGRPDQPLPVRLLSVRLDDKPRRTPPAKP